MSAAVNPDLLKSPEQEIPEFTTNARLKTLARLRETLIAIQGNSPADDLAQGARIAESLEIVEDVIRDALQDARNELSSVLSASVRLAALERRVKMAESNVGELQARVARAEISIGAYTAVHCPSCQKPMRHTSSAGVEDFFVCDNEECPRCDETMTRAEVENEEEAQGMRAEQTGPDAWKGGICKNH